MTVGMPVRIFALIGVLAAAGLAVAMLNLNRLHSSSSAPTSAVARPSTTAAPSTSAAHGTRAPAKPATHAAKAKPTAHAAETKPAAKAKPAPHVALEPGLPAKVAHALRAHRLVVVTLYAPGGSDAATLSEARAGAAAAHAPFVAIDVLRSNAAAVAALAGTVDDPATLVVRRPGKVVQRFGGRQDRKVVAQAVANAR